MHPAFQFVRFLTPTTLAAVSFELRQERDDLTFDDFAALDAIDDALDAIVGPEEAETLRQQHAASN